MVHLPASASGAATSASLHQQRQGGPDNTRLERRQPHPRGWLAAVLHLPYHSSPTADIPVSRPAPRTSARVLAEAPSLILGMAWQETMLIHLAATPVVGGRCCGAGLLGQLWCETSGVSGIRTCLCA